MWKKSLRFQCNSEKVLATCVGSPGAKAASYGNPTRGREGPVPLYKHWLGAAWGEHTLSVKAVGGPKGPEAQQLEALTFSHSSQ